MSFACTHPRLPSPSPPPFPPQTLAPTLPPHSTAATHTLQGRARSHLPHRLPVPAHANIYTCWVWCVCVCVFWGGGVRCGCRETSTRRWIPSSCMLASLSCKTPSEAGEEEGERGGGEGGGEERRSRGGMGRGWRARRRRRSLFRIVHVRGAIPNGMGPARCRATPALTSQSDPHPDLTMPAFSRQHFPGRRAGGLSTAL